MLILLFLAFFPMESVQSVQAQQLGPDYTMANRLLQQQEYELAYKRFLKLHKENPGSYLFLERLTECLINLKRYGEAAEHTRRFLDEGSNRAQAEIRLGEIYHIRGDSARADSIWSGIEQSRESGLQDLLYLARTLRDRRDFERSVRVYRIAGERYNDSSLITSELANTHLMAGNYEEAIQEYLRLIEEDATRIDDLQNVLMQNSNEQLYDTAILELEEFRPTLSRGNSSFRQLHQLHVWLLMERGLYERALSTSLSYEESSSQVTYDLYTTGRRLASEQQYELAEEALRYYVERNIPSVRQRTMHELADLYKEWGDYLGDYNLAFSTRRDSLYRKAYELLARLDEENERYSELDDVLVTRSELALDYLHRPAEAKANLERLESRSDSALASRVEYLRGRILLYDEQYARARIALTGSHKRERTGSLAEKARYHLALCDFFSGDFEFAKIQLDALEEQNTSYLANDAVRLRIWIQEGLQADSSGSMLVEFARAVRQNMMGAREESVDRLLAFVENRDWNPLKDDAFLQMAGQVNPDNIDRVYPSLQNYLGNEARSSPLEERLMWERVRMADQWLTRYDETGEGGEALEGMPDNRSDLVSLYEELLLRFPDGFYATPARNRIRELQNSET